MKVIKEEINFNCSADKLWEILSDIRRCDWIPSVKMIEVNGDCRVFEMLGMGKIKAVSYTHLTLPTTWLV